jgi:hypothetical protein
MITKTKRRIWEIAAFLLLAISERTGSADPQLISVRGCKVRTDGIPADLLPEVLPN